MRSIVLVVHNVRSAHNVGSLLRTADGLGVSQVYLTGYTPYPQHAHDQRLPHLAKKIDRQIHKTALGAEKSQTWVHNDDPLAVIKDLQSRGYKVCALEQDKRAIDLPSYQPPLKVALMVGNEVTGLEPEVLAQCSLVLEIPMRGQKESFNVVQATAMALYHITFAS